MDMVVTGRAVVDALKGQQTTQRNSNGRMKCTECRSYKHNFNQCYKAHPELAPPNTRVAIVNAK